MKRILKNRLSSKYRRTKKTASFSREGDPHSSGDFLSVLHETCAPDTWRDRVVQGDCLAVLRQMPSDLIDLVVTSPPYADSRKTTYGGVPPDKYVDWFLPIASELKRVLKPQGTFILNIKEKVVSSERHTYVMELVLGMRQQGWLWTEEFIWHKKNCYPGKWPNRFRDAWERCLQFNKQKKFQMHQESVMVPMGDWAKTRLKCLSETDRRRDNSRVESGFGKKIANWIGREMAYPPNVLHFSTECGNKNHSAAFPIMLPKWFIKLFTKECNVVLDPFLGSGTTAVAAQALNRHYLGIELQPEYVRLADEFLQNASHKAKLTSNGQSHPQTYSAVR